MELKESIVIITGAARGVGKAIANEFVSKGAKIALVDILEDELSKTAEEFTQSGGVILPIVTDITQASQVAEMARKVHDEFGPVDILVNNAGTFSVIGPVWEVDPERWFRDIRVNLYGNFLVCNAL